MTSQGRSPMADSTGLQFTVKVGALPESTFVVAEFALEEALNSLIARDLTVRDDWITDEDLLANER